MLPTDSTPPSNKLSNSQQNQLSNSQQNVLSNSQPNSQSLPISSLSANINAKASPFALHTSNIPKRYLFSAIFLSIALFIFMWLFAIFTPSSNSPNFYTFAMFFSVNYTTLQDYQIIVNKYPYTQSGTQTQSGYYTIASKLLINPPSNYYSNTYLLDKLRQFSFLSIVGMWVMFATLATMIDFVKGDYCGYVINYAQLLFYPCSNYEKDIAPIDPMHLYTPKLFNFVRVLLFVTLGLFIAAAVLVSAFTIQFIQLQDKPTSKSTWQYYYKNPISVPSITSTDLNNFPYHYFPINLIENSSKTYNSSLSFINIFLYQNAINSTDASLADLIYLNSFSDKYNCHFFYDGGLPQILFNSKYYGNNYNDCHSVVNVINYRNRNIIILEFALLTFVLICALLAFYVQCNCFRKYRDSKHKNCLGKTLEILCCECGLLDPHYSISLLPRPGDDNYRYSLEQLENNTLLTVYKGKKYYMGFNEQSRNKKNNLVELRDNLVNSNHYQAKIPQYKIREVRSEATIQKIPALSDSHNILFGTPSNYS